MRALTFENDNNNEYTLGFQDQISICYHLNTSTFNLLHSHADYWEFTVITDGEIINELNGEKVKCKEGTLFYSTTSDFHRLLSKNKNQKLRYFNLIVRENKLVDLANAISPGFKDFLIKGKHDYKVNIELVNQLEAILHKVNLLDKNHIHEYNDLLCSALILILQFLFLKSITESGEENSWINDFNSKLESPEFIKLNVNELCKSMSISRMQLNRLIKEHYHVTPHDLLVDYKLRYAKNLLISTDMKIKDIVEEIGYSSLSSFYKNFQEKFSETPNDVKRRN